ncbi:hypothetical protein EDC15_10222 [Acetobacter aceti NBRC 14818]|nr:hypothetical protein EDC15_10222 [Acetobacter aceti NBRC 14818]
MRAGMMTIGLIIAAYGNLRVGENGVYSADGFT